MQVFLAADRAFDQRDVDVLGKFLGVDQRAVDELELFRHIQQALVHVEKRHVTSGAAIEPDGGERFLLIMFLPHHVSDTAGTGAFQHFGHRAALFGQRAGRTDMHAFAAAGAGFRCSPGLVQIGDHLGLDAAAHHVPGVRALDFVAHADTARAQNAAVMVNDKTSCEASTSSLG